MKVDLIEKKKKIVSSILDLMVELHVNKLFIIEGKDVLKMGI